MRKNSRENKNLLRMNKTKLNVYKKVLYEVCEKFVGTDEFIKKKIEEICCQVKLSVEEVIHFVCKILCFKC